MITRIKDRRAIKLSQLKAGQIAITTTGDLRVFAAFYPAVVKNPKAPAPETIEIVELSNLTNQYLDSVLDKDLTVRLLERGESVEIEGEALVFPMEKSA
jgi:hypothetical protein